MRIVLIVVVFVYFCAVVADAGIITNMVKKLFPAACNRPRAPIFTPAEILQGTSSPAAAVSSAGQTGGLDVAAGATAKAPIDENDTIFGKIIRKEIYGDICYEDGHCIAFHDVSPQAPVHVLIVPRKHIARLVDAKPEDEATLGHLMLAAGKVAKKLGIEDAFRLVINNGVGAGQSVNHLHMHLLAGRELGWPPG